MYVRAKNTARLCKIRLFRLTEFKYRVANYNILPPNFVFVSFLFLLFCYLYFVCNAFVNCKRNFLYDYIIFTFKKQHIIAKQITGRRQSGLHSKRGLSH